MNSYQKSLSEEWAAIPVPSTGKSYYKNQYAGATNAQMEASLLRLAGTYAGKEESPSERSNSPSLTRKDVAGIQTNKDLSKANLTNANENNLDTMDEVAKANIILVNMVSSVSSSMNNLAKTIASGETKLGGEYGDEYNKILTATM